MLYRHLPHPRIGHRPQPATVQDALPRGSRSARFNSWLAVRITSGVGTMWCAYAFAVLAIVSLPAAVASQSPVILVAWVSQTFLQLVLLSVIIVGQNIQATASDRRAQDTYADAEAVLAQSEQIQAHLAAQDAALEAMAARLGIDVGGRVIPTPLPPTSGPT